ncbi:MAG: hypothetical protein KF861_05780 [Planctomycetaceae bacterium]|nr:hypothetical protein [Planctomycetaceae bacterium]
MESDERFFVADRVRLRQWLPWLHLFRAFRIAFRVRPIVLGAVAVLLVDAGRQLIARMPFATRLASNREWAHLLDETARRSIAVDPVEFSIRPWSVLARNADHGLELIQPLWTIVSPGRLLFERGQSWAHAATAWSDVLWALIVWSVCGVAIARMAALRLATDSGPKLRESLGYSFSKLPSSMGAPLLPMVGLLVLWLICLVGGLLGRIPSVGPVLIGLTWGIPLLLAGFMAVILLVIAVGWPLMLGSVATEDADAFDAFSRVWSYVFGRPWYALWMVMVGLVYGSLLLSFVVTVAGIVLPLSEWAVASGMGDERVERLLIGGGESIGFATSAVLMWRRLVGLLLVGYAVSYFWTTTTIIYFLLRQSVDAIPLTAVSTRIAASTNPSEKTIPLVGVAAAEQRESANGDPPAGENAS